MRKYYSAAGSQRTTRTNDKTGRGSNRVERSYLNGCIDRWIKLRGLLLYDMVGERPPMFDEGDENMPAVPLSQVAVQLRPNDNVAVAARHLAEGMEIQSDGVALRLSQRVGMGHKLALRDIKKGEAGYKYGQIIGFASQDIPAGSHVHVHNVAAAAFERDYAFCRDCPPAPPKPSEQRTFLGYDSGDGRFG